VNLSVLQSIYLRRLFAREPLRPAKHLLEKGARPISAASRPDNAIKVFTRQKAQLEDVLRQKEQELASIRAGMSGRSTLNRSSEREKYLERRKLQLEEELFDCEEKFHWADYSATDFAKEYLRIRKTLQIITQIN